MGVTFFWLSVCIPPEHSSAVASSFAAAVAASPVSPTARQVLDHWRKDPSSLSPESIPDPARPGFWTFTAGTEEFEELFRPEALSALGQRFIKTGADPDEWGIQLDENNGSLIITNRIPAAAALYFGLGPEQAALLPGHFGALFVPQSEVGGLLPALDALLARPSPEMLSRARRWLGGNNTRVRPEALFSFIPSALRIAQARKEGVLLLTAKG